MKKVLVAIVLTGIVQLTFAQTNQKLSASIDLETSISNEVTDVENEYPGSLIEINHNSMALGKYNPERWNEIEQKRALRKSERILRHADRRKTKSLKKNSDLKMVKI